MSARVEKLEALLSRVQRNRLAAPPSGSATAVAVAASMTARAPEPRAPEPRAPEPKKPSVHPPMPTHAVVTPRPPEAAAEAASPVRAVRPTPMEEAVVEFDRSPDSAVDVEITFDDEGNEITVEAGDEGLESFEDAAPTAPVDLRSPEPPARPVIVQPAAQTAAPLEARPIALAAAAPSGPVAHAISRHPRAEPSTFGELLDRTLALRPR